MKDPNVSQNPLLFVDNPYVESSQMRADVFAKQFTVYAALTLDLIDLEGCTLYATNCQLCVGHAGTVAEAITKAHAYIHQDVSQLKALVSSQVFPEEELDAVRVVSLKILDREGRLVIAGRVCSDEKSCLKADPSQEEKKHEMGYIDWAKPAASYAEQEKIKAEIADLSSKSAYEYGWDNFSTGRQLSRDADVLSLSLCDSPIVMSQFFKNELTQFGIFTS